MTTERQQEHMARREHYYQKVPAGEAGAGDCHPTLAGKGDSFWDENSTIERTTHLELSNTAVKDHTSNHSDRDTSVHGRMEVAVDTAAAHPHESNLTITSGAALLTADCMGTGILALPGDMRVLGTAFGIGFIIANLWINFYAGSILCQAATVVEKGNVGEVEAVSDDDTSYEIGSIQTNTDQEQISKSFTEKAYQSIDVSLIHTVESQQQSSRTPSTLENDTSLRHRPTTFDFIGMTSALFDSSGRNHKSVATYTVTSVYYVNIFLVLGNYILVMSHAVNAMLGDRICIPTAGIIASTLMFGVSQLRTMSRLGRTASVISLLALAVVVVQCLLPILTTNQNHPSTSGNSRTIRFLMGDGEHVSANYSSMDSNWRIMRKFAAASSIGFAVGSQKLLLNIRHEFQNRNHTPHSLAISLTSFGTVYILVCLLAGTNVPSFLFDVIDQGISRRIAGFMLWVHVSVSFAINSQALCSSLDRIWFHKCSILSLHIKPITRWACLSLLVSVSSYFVANAVPFFGDLVSLIGALTSVPLTLLLPAIFHRKVIGLPLFSLQSFRSKEDVRSFCLVLFSIMYLFCGVVGSLYSIRNDWAHHGPPFSCQ